MIEKLTHTSLGDGRVFIGSCRNVQGSFLASGTAGFKNSTNIFRTVAFSSTFSWIDFILKLYKVSPASTSFAASSPRRRKEILSTLCSRSLGIHLIGLAWITRQSLSQLWALEEGICRNQSWDTPKKKG